jgi:hypothetical protein
LRDPETTRFTRDGLRRFSRLFYMAPRDFFCAIFWFFHPPVAAERETRFFPTPFLRCPTPRDLQHKLNPHRSIIRGASTTLNAPQLVDFMSSPLRQPSFCVPVARDGPSRLRDCPAGCESLGVLGCIETSFFALPAHKTARRCPWRPLSMSLRITVARFTTGTTHFR